MNDALLLAFALLLIVTLAVDNRHYDHIWREDHHS